MFMIISNDNHDDDNYDDDIRGHYESFSWKVECDTSEKKETTIN